MPRKPPPKLPAVVSPGKAYCDHVYRGTAHAQTKVLNPKRNLENLLFRFGVLEKDMKILMPRLSKQDTRRIVVRVEFRLNGELYRLETPVVKANVYDGKLIAQLMVAMHKKLEVFLNDAFRGWDDPTLINLIKVPELKAEKPVKTQPTKWQSRVAKPKPKAPEAADAG